MLKQLSIKQFVIIDDLTLNFSNGLSVVTGETGAGKSILLDALGLILGDEADFEAVRYGSEFSDIEAHFTLPDNHPSWNILKEHNLVKGQNITVKRRIGKDLSDVITV